MSQPSQQVSTPPPFLHHNTLSKTTSTTMAEEQQREPVTIEGYSIGQEGLPHHFNASTTRDEAAVEAASLRQGDAAFIKRSDLKWTYAVITERNTDGPVTTLRFEVDDAKNRKSFPQNQWGKYIRVIKVTEPVEITAEEEAVAVENEENSISSKKDDVTAAVEEKKEETPAAIEEEKKEVVSAPVVESKPSGGWFSSIFGSSPKPAAKPTEETVAPAPPTVALLAATPKAADTKSSAAPTEVNPAKSDEENQPPSEQLASPKRNPSSILKFKFSKSPKNSADKLSVTIPTFPVTAAISPKADPTSPSNDEKWFDLEAKECDYDKNPTDLFQALEARQFDYAYEMYKHTNAQFTKDCKTWVIARGEKKTSPSRFRALPLHAAIVFGAPDELIKRVLRAYPNACRGRDVKGRLPIHLAFENNSSDEIISLIVDAFPKGFFSKDKKELTALDHVNGNTERAYIAKFIPQVIAAKLEEEREKWNAETATLLKEQRETLRSDEEFMADVIEHVQAEVEAHNMSKMELLEATYKKEIELLKKKHDAETQALLEGFEVKLNFEKKLNKLKIGK
jgi:hypothetical protein